MSQYVSSGYIEESTHTYHDVKNTTKAFFSWEYKSLFLVLSFLWSIWVEDWSTRKAISVRLIWAYPRDVSGAPSGCIAKEEMLWFWKCYGMGGHTYLELCERWEGTKHSAGRQQLGDADRGWRTRGRGRGGAGPTSATSRSPLCCPTR
jgi:hypothetical protein